MKKLGIGKKDKGDENDEAKRSHLFGGRSKSKSPAPPSNNPYAAPPSNNPYAAAPSNDPYAKKPPPMNGAYNTPPPYHNNPSGPPVADSRTRTEKSAVPSGGYGGQRGYGQPQSGYGSQGGYGNTNPYGTAPPGGQTKGGGGYGGLGNDDPNRNQLFGGAKDRYQERQKQQEPPPQQSGLPPEEQDQLDGGYGGNGYGEDSYKPYQERQLTAEEEEEEDVQGARDEIRKIKREDVSSTRNALRIAQQAEQTGQATLERLAAQGESIHNAERNLDMAASQNRLAEDKARELKHLNRSMWAMQVNNPFTKSRRARDRDEEIMNIHHSERERRDATRQAAWASQNRQQETARDLRNGPGGAGPKKGNLAERSKYQFEADSEDEAMEDEIDGNLEAMHGAVGRLNQLGKAMGKEVDVQNQHIERIGGKTDQVDDQIAMNRARLDRIH